MKRISLFILGICLALALGSKSTRGADDKTYDELDKAKVKFETDMKKLRADILDDFEKRLTKARDKGDKKLVEKIKDEQKAFELLRILSASADKVLRKRAVEVEKAIEKAYADTKKALFKAKKDEELAVIEKEWKQLQSGGLISVAPAGELWIPLFNGKDFTGWDNFGKPNFWRVVDGAIVGENNGTDIWLRSRRGDFEDFHIRLEVLCSPECYSNLHIRDTGGGKGSCYVVNVSGRGKVTGSLEKMIGGNYSPLKQASGKSPPANEWFTLEIVVRGYSITTLVNGEKMVEVVDEDKASARGAFTLGIFDNGSTVKIRKMEVIPLLSQPEKK
jgi:hypothetical protein